MACKIGAIILHTVQQVNYRQLLHKTSRYWWILLVVFVAPVVNGLCWVARCTKLIKQAWLTKCGRWKATIPLFCSKLEILLSLIHFSKVKTLFSKESVCTPTDCVSFKYLGSVLKHLDRFNNEFEFFTCVEYWCFRIFLIATIFLFLRRRDWSTRLAWTVRARSSATC